MAAGAAPEIAAVVMRADRVVAVTPAARAEGIEVGHRRRQAQARCPSLQVHESDPDRDARLFHAVGGALERFTPRIELSTPGVAAFPTRGPSRYFGGDQALAAAVLTEVRGVTGALGWPQGAGVGVADGRFVAEQVARRQLADPDAAMVLPPGGSRSFLAPMPVQSLARPELADVLLRLGLRTLGSFAALPAADVVARFGAEGLLAHRLAGGLDEHPPRSAPLPPHLSVTIELDPPIDRVDRAAFVARGLAEQLHTGLEAEGLSCTRVCIAAETDTGECNERLWRAEGALGVGAITDRVRWQLDGWLNGPAVLRPTSGISRLSLIPDEVGPARGRQLGFWGGETAADARAARTLARVQGLVGPDAVTVPERRGGRGPLAAVVRAPVLTLDPDHAPARRSGHGPQPPWPGRVPAPSPAFVPAEPRATHVLDTDRRELAVSGRGALSAPPAFVELPDGRTLSVAAWAGPWLVDERWWDTLAHDRRARLQLQFTDGRAALVACVGGRWSFEGWYD